MEEKIICTSDNIKKPSKVWTVLVLAMAICLIATIVTGIAESSTRKKANAYLAKHYVWTGEVAKNGYGGYIYQYEWDADYTEASYYHKSAVSRRWLVAHNILKVTSATLLVLVFVKYGIYFYLRKSKIIVSDKRVYGKAIGNREVDLPLNSITAVSISGKSQILVSTSSEVFKFYLQTKRDEIKQANTDLLLTQKKEAAPENPPAEKGTDDIRKYKELLDSGIITQEEFDVKKKQLLGL